MKTNFSQQNKADTSFKDVEETIVKDFDGESSN